MSKESSEYFQAHITQRENLPELELRGTPCEDCAVEWGLYTMYSQDLKEEPEEVQYAVSKKWFCHNQKGKACRGNANYLGIQW